MSSQGNLPSNIVEMIFGFADYFTCKICYSRPINTAIVPCGHVLCNTCLTCLQKFECPFCRADLEGALRLIMS